METRSKGSFSALRTLRDQLKPADVCLINRNNEQLFSTYSQNENDLYYLTGFEGSAGLLTVRLQDVILWVDRRYLHGAQKQFDGTLIQVQERVGKDWLSRFLQPWSERYRGRGGARLFIDRTRWSHHDVQHMISQLETSTWDHLTFSPPPSNSTPRVLDLENLPDPDERLKRCQAHIKIGEAHLLTCADDIAWITACRSNDYDFRRNVKGIALISREEAFLFSDLLPDLATSFQLARPRWRLIPQQDAWLSVVKTCLQRNSFKKLITACHHRPGSICNLHMEQLNDDQDKVVTQSRSLAELGRLEKQDSELRFMGQSQQKLCSLMGEVKDFIHHEMASKRELREIHVANRIDQLASQLGAIRHCFPPIVASGPNSLHPHHLPSQRRILLGEPIMLDIGFYFNEGLYATDMTRTILSDPHSLPHPRVREVYTAVLKAFLSQWAYPIKSDTTAQALDAIGRTILEPWKSDGYEFIHSTGHGVGISDHELGVTIGVNSKLTLRPRLCYSIEPGLYRQDNKGSLRDPYFGVRLEDVVVVTEEKKGVHHHESLGYFPFEKDLIDRSLLNENEQLALESYHRKCPHLEPPS